MYHPHRLSLFDGQGEHRHFLTISTYRRRKYFSHQLVVAMTLKQILRAARARSFTVSAYCFMPDHLHALVQGESDDASLRAFVRLAKQMSSYQFLKFTGRKLWRGSYWDRTVRGATTDVIRYIVANPIKAGLVSDPLNYPFWGSEICTREELLDLIDRWTAGPLGPADKRHPQRPAC